MGEALVEAEAALNAGDLPIGSVLVCAASLSREAETGFAQIVASFHTLK